jgi:YD repeat-containing protein
VTDGVVTKFDNLGRLWQQTRPDSEGQAPQWFTYEYDKLDRPTKVTAPDNAITERFYNESSYPSAARPGAPGQTIRVKDPWGRERWARLDAQNRLAEVVEPDPNGNGAVATNGLLTRYSYDTLGRLRLAEQGDQTRSFKYDALGRLTHQKLAEREATLNDAGQHTGVVGGTGLWSDVFSYDTRSNLVWRVEARGVKTVFTYNNDPLNRLQTIAYDKSGAPSAQQSSIIDAATVSYSYVTSGDRTRLLQVSDGMGTDAFTYDSEGRMNQQTRTLTGRPSNPLAVSYLWDSLDRLSEVTYPTEYFQSPATRKIAHYNYDLASRLAQRDL